VVERGLVPLSLPPSLQGGIQHFSGNKTPIFRYAGREEMEANEGHRSDRTLDRTRSLFDRTRPVSAQCLRMSRCSDRTRWRVRSWWVLTGLKPDAGTVASGSSSVRIRSLTRWSAAWLDQRVRSVTGPARPVELRTSGVCDQHVRSARLQQNQVPNGSFLWGTSINTCWPALWSNSWLVDPSSTPLS
jgi:hypothetical protein